MIYVKKNFQATIITSNNNTAAILGILTSLHSNRANAHGITVERLPSSSWLEFLPRIWSFSSGRISVSQVGLVLAIFHG